MKKNVRLAAAVALALSSVSFAQHAVQWKVSDGGNGHWYQIVQRTYGTYDWNQTRAACIAIGGDLASFETSAEWAFMRARCRELPPGPINSGQLLAGGRRSAGASSQWTWLTGQTFSYFAWNSGAPNDGTGQELVLCVGSGIGSVSAFDGWDDWRVVDLSSGYVIEWSADCNGDGIVDYGQCRDGSLPDYNGNNIPDCCESGTPCVVGNYPVQWRVAEGGNGHWYQWIPYGSAPNWTEMSAACTNRGGHLATITTAAEDSFVRSLFRGGSCVGCGNSGIFVGGYQDLSAPDLSEPQGAWRWVTGEPWSFTDWYAGEPNNMGGIEHFLALRCAGQWNDGTNALNCSAAGMIEWSADCNNDGLVDKGQILRGQLADSDNDGIPNVCECICDVFRDFNVNGIDLGVLLGQWGPANQFTVTDFNQDGSVDGFDLGVLLGAWGPCPN